MSVDTTATAPPCPQAWHGGLHDGLPVKLLIECRFPAKHRGWHRNADGTVSWGGKLTPEEMATAEALRAERSAAARG